MANYNNYGGRNNNRSGGKPQTPPRPKKQFKPLEKLTCVAAAEQVVKDHLNSHDERSCITSTKIRDLLDLVNEIKNVARNESGAELSEDIQSKVLYTRMKFAYEAGKDKKVKEFMNDSLLMEHLNYVGKNREYLMLIYTYMEAIIGFYRFYGGREK